MRICSLGFGDMLAAANMLVMTDTVAMARRAGVDVARLPQVKASDLADPARQQGLSRADRGTGPNHKARVTCS